MSVPSQSDLLTLDYYWRGLPYIDATIQSDSLTLDYYWNGLPFIGEPPGGGPQAYTRTINETITLSDDKAALFSRGITDSISSSDNCSPVLGGGGVLHTKDLSDSMSLSEALVLALSKGISESLSLTDLMALSFSRGISDSFTLSDNCLPVTSVQHTKALSDSTDMNDAASFRPFLTNSEAVTLSDIFGKMPRPRFSDAVMLSEAEAGRSILCGRIDAVTMADFRTTSTDRAFSDGISVTDGKVSQIRCNRAETLPLIDTQAKTVLAARNALIALSDSRGKSAFKPLLGTIFAADAIRKAGSRAFSDALSSADSMSKKASRAIADTVGSSDSRTGGVRACVSDRIEASDSSTKSSLLGKSDSMTTSDIIGVTLNIDGSTSIYVNDSWRPVYMAAILIEGEWRSIAEILRIASGVWE